MKDSRRTAPADQTASACAGNRLRINLLVAAAVILQFARLVLSRMSHAGHLTGLALVGAGMPLMVAGCADYARQKGQSRWFGLAGLLGAFGLLILIVLPDRSCHSPAQGWPYLKLFALLFLAAGLVLAAFGIQLDKPLAVVDRVDPWPAVCMVAGAVLVIGSIWIIGNRQIR